MPSASSSSLVVLVIGRNKLGDNLLLFVDLQIVNEQPAEDWQSPPARLPPSSSLLRDLLHCSTNRAHRRRRRAPSSSARPHPWLVFIGLRRLRPIGRQQPHQARRRQGHHTAGHQAPAGDVGGSPSTLRTRLSNCIFRPPIPVARLKSGSRTVRKATTSMRRRIRQTLFGNAAPSASSSQHISRSARICFEIHHTAGWKNNSASITALQKIDPQIAPAYMSQLVQPAPPRRRSAAAPTAMPPAAGSPAGRIQQPTPVAHAARPPAAAGETSAVDRPAARMPTLSQRDGATPRDANQRIAATPVTKRRENIETPTIQAAAIQGSSRANGDSPPATACPLPSPAARYRPRPRQMPRPTSHPPKGERTAWTGITLNLRKRQRRRLDHRDRQRHANGHRQHRRDAKQISLLRDSRDVPNCERIQRGQQCPLPHEVHQRHRQRQPQRIDEPVLRRHQRTLRGSIGSVVPADTRESSCGFLPAPGGRDSPARANVRPAHSPSRRTHARANRRPSRRAFARAGLLRRRRNARPSACRSKQPLVRHHIQAGSSPMYTRGGGLGLR